ncbi:hypothetical protein BLNAU_7583 [Blattamonas nauphoetae]|uniref:Uncharacterized protein n=1 Tax=Blattamonas nauphoetae TaxID=2049346 RepID=A0ABQ9Y107_9EUKA|nr:hypothetical protein BLNAU_7583 [Blattamonas nauphoetae]
MQRKQVNSCSIVPLPHSSPIVGVADPWHYAAQTGELLLDRAPSLTHPRSLASPIPGIMQRKQVNSCSIVPLPHSSPIVGVADPWHYAAQTGELLLDRAPSLTHPRSLASPIPGIMQRKQVNSCSIVPPPSLIPDRWRRRSLALCSANRCELLLDRAPSLTHPRSLASPIPGIMQRKQVCSPYFSFFHHFISFLSGELLLDRAPSLTHPRSLASPIPGIMQRKQVNSCSIVPLPHSSPIVGVADPWHYAAQTGELLLDRAPSLTHPRSLASPIPGIMQRKQVCSPYFSFFHHFISFLSGELLLDRAPSLTHPRSLASPIPGIMQRKQVNSCSIVPLPHSSPIVGVADPWHYAAQTGELLLDRAPSLTHPRSLASPIPGIMQRKQVNSCSIVPPPSLIPDRWRRRSLALCSANRCELLLDRAPSLTHPRSLASPIPGIMQRKQVNSCSIVPPPSLIPDRWRRRSLALCSANRCELLLDRAPSLTHPRSLASPIPGIMQRKQVNSCSIVPPPSLIPDRWRRRSLALCSANRCELLLDRAPSLTHPRSLASPIPGIMQRKQVYSLRSHGVVGGAADSRHTTYSRRFPELKQRLHFIPTPLYLF